MKKYFIIAAAAALALASCAKFETYTENNLGDELIPVGFSNYAPRAVGKANDTFVNGTSLVNGKHFGVYSYAVRNNETFAAKYSTIGPNFMDNVDVTFTTAKNSTSSGIDDYSPKRYWPSGNTPDKLSFWAYYPYGATGITPTVTTGMGSFAFVVQSPASSQVDFLVSDVNPDLVYSGTTNGVVELDFHHMLTKVQFYFKTDKPDSDTATEVKITSATLTNVKTKGTLTPVYPSEWVDGRWSEVDKEDTPKTFTVATNLILNEAGKTPNGTAPNATYPDTDNIYLMIPQTMAASGQTLTINYTVTTTGGGDAITNTAIVELVDVKTGDPAATINWSMNKVVTYTITVGLHPVKFQADVAEWGATSEGNINVN